MSSPEEQAALYDELNPECVSQFDGSSYISLTTLQTDIFLLHAVIGR